MIYTLISDLNYVPEFKESDLSVNSDNNFSIDKSAINNEIALNKRDCRVLRQPLSLLPEEIEKFIIDTKNPLTRAERRLAYTTLLLGVKILFGIDKCAVSKAPDGKPYLVINEGTACKRTLKNTSIDSSASSADFLIEKFDSENSKEKYQKNEDLPTSKNKHQKNTDYSIDACSDSIRNQDDLTLYVSISHSEGAVAVCISDEGEVGVDIQSEISIDKAEKLEKRFLPGIKIKNENLGVIYYYCNISGSEASFTEIDPSDADDTEFVSKWSYAESILKLYGNGFGDLCRLNELTAFTRTEIRSYYGVKKYAICTAVQREL